MKRCPTCLRTYADDTLRFCLLDGASLVADAPSSSAVNEPPPTEILYSEPSLSIAQPARTEPQIPRLTEREWQRVDSAPKRQNTTRVVALSVLATILLLGLGGLGTWLLLKGNGEDANRNSANDNGAQTAAGPATAASASPSVKAVSNNSARSTAPPAPTPERAETRAPAPGGGTWLVFLGSFAKTERYRADERLSFLQARGYEAYVIDTDEYPNLRGGYWSVVMGPYSKTEAQDVANRMLSVNPQKPYVKSGW